MYRKLCVVAVLTVLFLASQGFSQDLGIPDTVVIEPTTISVGESSPVGIRLVNDIAIQTIEITLKLSGNDGGYVNYDSVTFDGRLLDPNVLNARIVKREYLDGSPPDLLFLIALFKIGPNIEALPPGNNRLFNLYFTGVSQGTISIDTITSGHSKNTLAPSIPNYEEYVPNFSTVSIEVTDEDLPPKVQIDSDEITAIVGDNILFQVGANSPEGYPVTVSLGDVTAFDDPSVTPGTNPSFTGSNPGDFQWTPTINDVGIWRVNFLAADSAGNMRTEEMLIQIVSNPAYIVDFEIQEVPNTPFSTGIVHADFDNDDKPELFISAIPMDDTRSYAVYDIISGSEIVESSIYHNGFEKLNPILGYFNEDDAIDLIVNDHLNLMILLSNGDNTFSIYDNTTPNAYNHRDATLTDYNGDAYIDYVCAGKEGIKIFTSDDSYHLTLVKTLLFAETATSVNSADFNDDGWDDLAVGLESSLQIFLSDGLGGYTLDTSYSQTYGSLDIEITNRGSDFNNDNIFDICLASPSVGGLFSDIYVYLSDGQSNNFEQRLIRTVKGIIYASFPGDFNGDNELDIAYINSAERYLGILYGDGNGVFTNELRFTIPKYVPRDFECLDYDLDGDLDIIVSSYDGNYYNQPSFFLYKNQLNPNNYFSTGLRLDISNSTNCELLSPSGKVLNKVRKTMSSGNYLLRKTDNNQNIDATLTTNAVEKGQYQVKVEPQKTLPTGTPFSLTYEMYGTEYVLADNQAMSDDGFVFDIYPDGLSPIEPVNGARVYSAQPSFSWPGDKSGYTFQLATDLAFTDILEERELTENSYTLQTPLPSTNKIMYYWRVKPSGVSDYESVNSFCAFEENPNCCRGMRGNVNCSEDEEPDVSDIIAIIAHLYITKTPLCCPEEADCDASGGGPDISDIVKLIGYLYLSHSQPAPCP